MTELERAAAHDLLSIGAGYSELTDGDDDFQKCQQRADENLYLDKARQKARKPASTRW